MHSVSTCASEPDAETARFGSTLERCIGPKKRRSYALRLASQGGFALFLIWIGWLFARFVATIRGGELPLAARPPSAEAFLPITGQMGALDWLYQGRLNTIHPAATLLFVAFTACVFAFRKSFCSWICPVGLLSERLAALGRRIVGRNLAPPTSLDIPLRSLKYLLLVFFVWAIGSMHADALAAFIHAPYNRVSDVKMYLFFADLSTTAAVVLALLALGSVFVEGFWCRYLCPYGAWFGLFSFASPLRIKRNAEACLDCGMCDAACMARLPVSSKARIISAECTGCLDCVATCPEPNALVLGGSRRLSAPVFWAGMMVLVLSIYATARWTGHWRSAVTEREYIDLYQVIDQLTH